MSRSDGEVPIAEEKEAIRDLIQNTAYLLNHEQFVDYMNTFADTSTYEMVVRSREIGGKENVWLRLDKQDMMQLLSEVSDQVRDEGERLHLVSPINLDVGDEEASCLSHFAVFRTSTAGESNVYAVGHYEDSFVKRDGKWWYTKHRAVIHTRMLEISTHLPI
jgi:3-phenylpropionate/cinnamic acid dioxygenase small subunit